MTYHIRCKNRIQECATVQAFVKHYGTTNPQPTMAGVKVKTGEHTFIFFREGATRSGEISVDEFVKKYFAQK